MNPTMQKVAFLLLPALVGILLYSNSFNNEYVLDDEEAIVQNRIVQQGLDGISEIWVTEYRAGFSTEKGSLYRPMALTLFAIESEIWPQNPKPAHVINLLLYGLCCMVLYLWLRLLFRDRDHWLALMIAVIFAAHPIHTEVVANIKSADEILSLLFGLLALIGILKYFDSKSLSWMFTALIAFFFALSSKEGVILLVPVAFLMLFMFRKAELTKAGIHSAILMIPTGIYLWMRSKAIGGLVGSEEIPMLDNVLVSASGLERLTSAMSISLLYLVKLVYPATLSHDYSYNQIEIVGLSAPSFWIAFIVLVALVYCIWKWRSTKPIVAFSVLFFLLTFSLYSNLFVTIGTHFGERLLFVPSIGFCMALGWGFWHFGKGKAEVFHPRSAALSMAFFGIIVFIMATQTIGRSALWKDEITLFTADVVNAPKSTRTHFRLGRALNKKAMTMDEGSAQTSLYNQAKSELEESVAIYPKFTDALGELGLVHQNLKEYEKAMSYNERVLKINPNHHTTINNIGAVLFLQGNPEAAIPYFKRALELNPNFRDPAGNLGSCFGTLEQYEEAIKWFKVAVDIDPNYAPNYFFIALTYQNLGKQAESNQWIAKARAIDPNIGR